MNTTFHGCVQSSAELINSACFLRFSFGHIEYTFSNKSSQYFSYGNRTDSWSPALSFSVKRQ